MSEYNGSGKSPAAAVARSVSELAQDALTLAELQGELFKAELREFRRAMIMSVALLAVTALLAVGSVPVLLLSLAYSLIEFAGMSPTLSLLIATLVGAFAAAAAAVIGLRRLRGSSMTWERSREEFSRNVKWLKQALTLKARPAGSGCESASRSASIRRGF